MLWLSARRAHNSGAIENGHGFLLQKEISANFPQRGCRGHGRLAGSVRVAGGDQGAGITQGAGRSKHTK